MTENKLNKPVGALSTAAARSTRKKQVDTRNFASKFPSVAKAKKSVFAVVAGLPPNLESQALTPACHQAAGAPCGSRVCCK